MTKRPDVRTQYIQVRAKAAARGIVLHNFHYFTRENVTALGGRRQPHAVLCNTQNLTLFLHPWKIIFKGNGSFGNSFLLLSP